MNIKFKCIVSSVIILIAYMETGLITTYASNDIVNDSCVEESNEEYNDFYEYKDQYTYVAEKVDDEIDNTELSEEYEDLEKYFNENGIFDEDIEAVYEYDELDNFNELDDLDDISISVQYYAVEDSVEDTDEEVSLESSDFIRLSDDEVNMYIAEKFYGQDMGLEEILEDKIDECNKEQEKERAIDSVLENIGIKPIEVYAETQTKQGTNILKKVVTCTKSGNDFADTQIVAVWDTMPKNRKLDSIEILCDECKYERDAGEYSEITITHFYSETTKKKYTNETYSRRVRVNVKEVNRKKLSDNEFYTYDGDIFIAMRLHSDDDYLGADGYAYTKTISKEGIKCNCYLRRLSYNKKKLRLDVCYLHLVSSYNPVNIIITALDKAKITAAYMLITGSEIEYTYTRSGDKDFFEFNFK